MFQGFANVWTPVVPAHEVRGEESFVEVASSSLSVSRDERGRLVALAAGDRPLPVLECGGLVWVFTGSAQKGAEASVASPFGEGERIAIHVDVWPASFPAVMEALLDGDNLPFVWSKCTSAGASALRRFHLAADASSATLSVSFGDADAERVLLFRGPNSIELFLSSEHSRQKARAILYSVPETDTTTRLIFCSAREAPCHGPVDWIADWFVATSLTRERALLPRRSDAELDADPDGALSAVRLFRRHHERALRSSSALLLPFGEPSDSYDVAPRAPHEEPRPRAS